MHIEIYTDGGCEPNPGFGAWAAVIIRGGKITKISGVQENTTNNRMELIAALNALRALGEPARVTVYTDSKYLQQGMTRWLSQWMERDWVTVAGSPVKNADIWRELYFVSTRHQITWRWVRGHADNEWNNMANDLVEELLSEELSI